MVAGKLIKGLKRVLPHIPSKYPATGWYFTDDPPPLAYTPDKDKWTCMISQIGRVGNGEPICFSSEQSGCSGAACYLGFAPPSPDAGRFLSEKECYKKDIALANAFYQKIGARPPKKKFMIWQSISHMDNQAPIEVITLWTDGEGLASLVTLANYDHDTNENVIIPFASGCQSIWTLPYNEKVMNRPKAIVGCMDPAIRRFLESDTLSFSVSAERFAEMTDNIAGSFLDGG